MALDAEPLPDEEFDRIGVPEEIHVGVSAILYECEARAVAILDVEHRAAMRRFLARAARYDPTLFRRKGSPVRGAAAVAWVICTANSTIGSYRSPMAGKDLLAQLGITGSVSDRAQSLVRAAGIDPNLTYGSLRVGDPGLLVSGGGWSWSKIVTGLWRQSERPHRGRSRTLGRAAVPRGAWRPCGVGGHPEPGAVARGLLATDR